MTLALPERFIIIVCGLPGTGKSYFGERLSEHVGAFYINTDRIRGKDQDEMYSDSGKKRVYDKMLDILKEDVHERIVFDATFYKAELRAKYEEEAKKMNLPVFFIKMEAEEQTVKDRLRRDREYSDADYKVYRIIKADFDPLMEEHLTLWSDKESLADMLLKTKDYILQKHNNHEQGTS